MRNLLIALLWLYGASGLALAVWAVAGIGAPADDPLALPLPAWIVALAAGLCLAIAAGGLLRRSWARPLAVLVHALVAVAAIAMYALHVAGVRPMHGDRPLLESCAKALVHGALCAFWLRSRTVARLLDGVPDRDGTG